MYHQMRIEGRQETLKLIGSMNSSIGTKAAETLLLKMKTMIPEVFADLCLYRLYRNCFDIL